ncbi:hypothetical protein [Kribbella monticola]|uniref:hypothetical protein n=1 Tax=Kribbella monticola TaxID=2185285 RepID=UPI000DD3DB3F|nr:hypothetical protein [Kribbella monticola]
MLISQHIEGMPVEELLLAAIATATPVIALIGWEIRDRLRRFRSALRRTEAADQQPAPETP